MRVWGILVLVVGSTLLATTSFGAGFALIEQSARMQGYAYAGAAAVADDASTVFFNPAGMAAMQGNHLLLGLQLVVPKAEFENDGSGHFTGMPLAGGDGGDGGSAGVVPNMFYIAELSERWRFGLGLNVPFGLETDYEDGWVGRYHALNSKVSTVNINPSAAFRVNDMLSVGAGISAQYLDATLSNAIDFGGMDAAGAFASAGIPAGALGLVPQQSDGEVKLDGTSWAYGFNLGVLLEVSDATRIGLAYRSGVDHEVEGDAKFKVPASIAPLQAFGYFSNSDVSADVDLPATASLSLTQQLGSKVTLLADVTWTEWSSLPELRFDFDNSMPDGVTTLAWDDSWRYALGLIYVASDALTLRTGVAFDETPIPGAEERTPRIPGEDRTWVSLGCGYRFSDMISVDAAYSHLFVDDPELDKKLGVPGGENFFRGSLKGTYDASVDIASMQLNVHF